MTTKISVIVPAYNASSTLRRCLDALNSDSDDACEIIVVNDCSTDDTVKIASQMGVPVLRTSTNGGPSAARNLGAHHATGQILFFVDADVVIQQGSIALVREVLDAHPQIAAVFGSYDDAPAAKNFLSQYKNLAHHFVHQNSNVDAVTFWAGCGAIRKDVFLSIKGFDAQTYPHPSIEDIELGLRLKQMNHSIRLEKRLQGKHLKKWTVRSLLKADILHRAYPWSRLIAEKGEVPNQLNLQTSHRISALLSASFFADVAAGFLLWSVAAIIPAILLLAGVIFLNRDLYRFFLKKKGVLFVCGAVFWHMLYYVYSAIIFVYCWIRFHNPGRRATMPAKVEAYEKR